METNDTTTNRHENLTHILHPADLIQDDLDDNEPFDPACCGDPASCYAACRNSDGTPWSPACS